jgi:hypothetical protein
MTKSKKNIKKSRQSRQPRQPRQNSINIDNTGLTEFIYKEGKQPPKKTVFEWNGNYDGKNAKIHMDLEVNGEKTKTDLKLSNQDLMNILGSTSVVEQPLDQRLQSLDKDLSIMYPNTPIFIHSGEMPLNEIPLNMSLDNEIIDLPLNMSEMPINMSAIVKSNHDVKKGKRKSKKMKKVKGREKKEEKMKK